MLDGFLSASSGKGKSVSDGFSDNEDDVFLEDFGTRYLIYSGRCFFLRHRLTLA